MLGILILLFGAAAGATDWPQWRGIHRDGTSPETGLLKEWPQGGPRPVWKLTGLGEGYSAFSVVKGRLFTQGQHGEQEYVIAIDAATGKKLWETKNGQAYRERRGNGPRGTPTTDGDRVYAMAADGNLICLRMADGKVVWEVDTMKVFDASVPHWGISESPLIDGEKLIATPGGSKGGLVAFDKMTGKVLWKAQTDPAGYSSPIAVEMNGKRQYVTLTSSAAVGVAANNGELLWKYDKVSNRTANIATPIYKDGMIFVSTDYGTGCALLRLNERGSAQEVYFNREMKNHYSSSVLVGDYLYGFNSTILTAMNFKTGDVAWKDRSVGKGSVTYADGMLFLLSERGVVGLAEATPQGYREKSRFQIPPGDYNTWTPPVIADGKMYLREQDNLYCYDVRSK